jgi:hypothetical protein
MRMRLFAGKASSLEIGFDQVILQSYKIHIVGERVKIVSFVRRRNKLTLARPENKPRNLG